MTTATKIEIITIDTASRNLSLDWAVSQRDTLSCPKSRGGIRSIEKSAREAKCVAGGLYYRTALYVDGKRVISYGITLDHMLDPHSAIDFCSQLRCFGALFVRVEA